MLNDQQVEVIKSDQQYVFLTGPPGCGKTLVLAEKTVQWLQNGETVFLVFKHGKFTSLPATEFLWHFIEDISNSGDVKNEFRCVHKRGMSSDTNIEEFIEYMTDVKNKPDLGNIPRKPKRRPADEMFDQITGHAIPYETVFTPLALRAIEDCGIISSTTAQGLTALDPGCQGEGEGEEEEEDEEEKEEKEDEGEEEEEKDTAASQEAGSGINVVIDELTMRTIKGKRAQLIWSIQQRLPCARIWCAGSFPTHCPENFHREDLSYAYRCPPTTQRLLEAVEPFCHSDHSCMFDYISSCTQAPKWPMSPGSEENYRLPDDGPDPVFFSHAKHKTAEVIDCKECAVNLVKYCKNTLHVAKSGECCGLLSWLLLSKVFFSPRTG